MREAEDVVDEEQHVLALIAEVLRDGQPREADAGARAGRLVHLPVHQRALGARGRAVVLLRVLVHARLDHLVIEVVALARALAHAGEHRVAAVRLRDVVDQLHDQHGLADAGAAEQADLAALGVGREQVHDLDAGDQDFRLGRLVGVERCILMDRALLRGLHRARLVDRIADHVDDAPEAFVADRHLDRLPGVGDCLPAHETFRCVHRDGAHRRLAEMLRNLEHEAAVRIAVRFQPGIVRLQRVQDRRQMALELHVHDGADDLGDFSGSYSHVVLSIET